MKRFLLIFTLFLCCIVNSTAQELKCELVVNSDKVQNKNPQLYATLQNALNEFVNNRKWSDLQLLSNERIECTFVITVNAQSATSFNAEIQIQARRPVYNSSYYTPIFNVSDKNLNFTYIENEALEFNETTFESNLTSTIAYYIYIIIGMDCDSYAKFEGTPYYKKAENIVTLAQTIKEKGWKAFEDDRNRYALINNLLDDNLRKFRELYYEYHRLGLDEMNSSMPKASAKISESIQVLREVNRLKPNSVVISYFLDSKNDELINIFQKAPSAERKAVYELLMDINPSQSEKYAPLNIK